MLPIPIPSSLAFFLEMTVPGVFGAILAYPLLPQWARLDSGPSGLAGFVAFSLLIGFVPLLIRLQLAEFAMGRYWPSALREAAIRGLQSKVTKAREDLAKFASADLPPPSAFSRLYWKQRLLDLFIVGPDRTRVVYAPTVIGNAYLAIVADLAEHFEVEEHLKGNKLATLTVPAAVVRGWFLLPRELRAEIAESGAVGVSLARLSAIAAGLSVVYFAMFATNYSGAGGAIENLVLGLGAAVVARITYVAAVSETHSNLQTIRHLLIPLDRDTIHGFREYLRSQLQSQSQPQPPAPPQTAQPPKPAD